MQRVKEEENEKKVLDTLMEKLAIYPGYLQSNAMELKSFGDMYDYRKGIEQAADYGRQMHLKEIVLLVFVELSEEEIKELDREVEKPGIKVIVIPVGTL